MCAAPENPWASLSGVATALGSAPMRTGNRVELLTSGEETFQRIFDAVARARHHVHIEKYTFRSDKLGGRLLDLLTARAREGIQVRLIVDAVGSFGIWRLIRRLKAAGGAGVVFLPILPIPKYLTPNLRNHRKIVVIDGSTGFMGGINVGEEYLGRRRAHWEWLDAHLVIEGPSVLDLQRVFVEDWDFSTGAFLDDQAYFPPTGPAGGTCLQVVPSGPDQETTASRQIYLCAINQSRGSLLLASPYIVPDPSLRDALVNAALRGVAVDLLTQKSPPDHWLPYWSARYYWEELLESGVRIHQYTPGMMHAKVVAADGAWASVGSANLDSRSLRLNFEVNGVSTDPAFVARVEAAFHAEIARSREIRLDEFRRRGRLERAGESFAHLFAPLL